jgi:hypothetical protein
MLYPVISDLQNHLVSALDRGEIDLDRLVVVEEPPNYPGELMFQPIKGAESLFYSRYRDWVSPHLVLSELFNLPPFVEQLQKDGYQVVFGPSCEYIFWDFHRWAEPMEVTGYQLHGFQQFSLRRAYERRYWFFNWATGAGKSFIQAVAAKDLFDRGEIEVVIACTVPKSKINQARFYIEAGLDAVVNDGTKSKRTKVYAERHQVYVMNYEKLNFDFGLIRDLCWGRKVLFVFDEATKVVNAEQHNKARRSFEAILPLCHGSSKVWPMSASVVGGNPLRFHDVFGLGSPDGGNPLGTADEFTRRYAEKIETYNLKTAKGKTFTLTNISWNQTKLTDIRHRVGSYTQTARKTDPGIAHLFKELQTLVEPIQISPAERKLTEAIVTKARIDMDAWEALGNFDAPRPSLKPYYDMLRFTLNAPLALRHSNHDAARSLAADLGDELDKITSSKVERLNEMLAELRDEGSKCLVFTHWTTLSLHLIKDLIEVPHVVHFGSGQSAKESQEAQDRFKATPDITCFFTSDAGMMGLNMQEARVVIQLDPTYNYDDTYQRASRIHRADSHLDGLTNYVFLADGTVDERVWQQNYLGRVISEAVQGTTESLNFGGELTWADRERAQRSEADNLRWMIFGED